MKFPIVLRVLGRTFREWWDGWLDMVMMTAVWFFAQLTIVLGPPATFGVYYAVNSMVNGQSVGVRGMIEGARKHFWRALLWGLINLLVVFTIAVNFNFYSNIEASWGLYLVMFVGLLTFLWIGTNFYALPYYSMMETPSLKVALRNGILTTLASPVYTFVLLIPVVLIVVGSVTIILPLFLGLPAFIPMLGIRAVEERLVSFGLRNPEKTPKEIEIEESEKLHAPSGNLPQESEPSKPRGRR